MAAPGNPSAAQFQTELAHGILLTKYSRNNKPSERLVYSRGGNRITWRPPDAGQRFKQLLRPLTLRSSKIHSMIGLVYFHPGVPSADWFNGEVPPPPLSFAILTTTRLVRLVAPSLDVYVACLHGFEAILANQSRNDPQRNLRQSPPTLTKQPTHSPLQASSSRARLLADGSVDMGVLMPQTPTSHTFDLAVPVDGFLALYDEVLAGQSPLGMDTSPWEVISNSKGDNMNAGGASDTTGSEEVPCLSRRMTTQHMTSLKIPGFKNVNVAKTMAIFMPTDSRQKRSSPDRRSCGDAPASVATVRSSGTENSNGSSSRSRSAASTSNSASLLVLEANRFTGSMYSDYFVVYARFVVTPIDPNSCGTNFGCTVTISTSIAFLNSTFLQSAIVSEFMRHSPWVYRRWAALAQEHLAARTNYATLTLPSPLRELMNSATNKAGHYNSLSSERAEEVVQEGAHSDFDFALRHSPVGRALSRAMATHMSRDQRNPKGGTAGKTNLWLNSTPSVHASTPAEAIEGFICPVCGDMSASQGGLMAHYTSNHMDDELHRASDSDSSSDDGDGDRSDGSRPKGSSTFTADDKQAAFPSSAVEAPAVATGFVCPDCYSKFGSANELTLHYKIQHGDMYSRQPSSSLPNAGSSDRNNAKEDDESVGDAVARDMQATMDSMASLFTAEWTWETTNMKSSSV